MTSQTTFLHPELGVTLYANAATAKALASRVRCVGDTSQVWIHHPTGYYMPLAHEASRGTWEPVYYAIERGDLELAYVNRLGYGWERTQPQNPALYYPLQVL